jgi:hypothetical protein
MHFFLLSGALLYFFAKRILLLGKTVVSAFSLLLQWIFFIVFAFYKVLLECVRCKAFKHVCGAPAIAQRSYHLKMRCVGLKSMESLKTVERCISNIKVS